MKTTVKKTEAPTRLDTKETRHLLFSALHHPEICEAIRNAHGKLFSAVWGDTALGEPGLLAAVAKIVKDTTALPGDDGFHDHVRKRTREIVAALKADKYLDEDDGKELRDAVRDALDHPNRYSVIDARAQWPRFLAWFEYARLRPDPGNLSPNVPTSADFRDAADRIDAAGTIVTDLPDANTQKTDLFKWLAARRGKELLGLKTGDPRLDQALNGLKGVNIFAGNEGCGKTSRVLQAVRGVLRYNTTNDAVAVVVSLDMEKHVLLARMVCAAADVTYRTYVKGSENCKKKSKNHPHPHHSVDDWEKIQEAEEELFAKLGKDLVVVGSEAGEVANAKTLCTLVERAKEKSGHKRALLVVDYFQLLGAPGLDALDADRFRVDELKRVVAQGRKNGDDFGAVIAISEMRKRLAGAKATAQDGSDIMGSTRIKYAAEATLLMSHASDAEVVKVLSTTDKNLSAKDLSGAAAKHRRTLSEAGKSIITVALDKGRDGTQRGTWYETFNFNTYTFTECVAKVNVPGAAKVQ